jgi:chemotaxis protein MotB
VVKKHVEEEGGGEGWLISYCDMISLLVTFFLMMMTFSTSESGDISDAGVGVMKGKGGIWPRLIGTSMSEALDPEELRELATALDAAARDESGEPTMVMQEALDGLALRFDDRCSFARGSAKVGSALAANMRRLGEMLARQPVDCVVEGYGDDDFESTALYESNEMLGNARALAAAKVLLAVPGVDKGRVSIAHFGSERKRDMSDNDDARDKNRRVEVRLLAIRGLRANPGGK